MTLLIKNGRVIDPATRTDKQMDILVEDDRIAKRAEKIDTKADKTINAKGCYVMPGFIDMHVHLRDPGQEEKETVVTGSRAAARGGFTTILAMPNTKPVVDNADVVHYCPQQSKEFGTGACAADRSSHQGTERRGACGDRRNGGGGKPCDQSKPGRVCHERKASARRDEDHAETGYTGVIAFVRTKISWMAACVDADANAKREGLRGITNSVEDVIIARDIMIAKDTGAALHLCRCSTKSSVMMVQMAKEQGVRVTAEVCPHHFTLTSDDYMIPKDTNYKMNPPATDKEKYVEELKRGLKEDIMDVIATDHAPHTADEKNNSMEKAPFGIGRT